MIREPAFWCGIATAYGVSLAVLLLIWLRFVAK
jgi:hypothetical protein